MASFTYGPALESFFERNRIFLKHAFQVAGVYKPGDVLTIPDDLVVERYATMPPRKFLPMGAYSYCMSKSLGAGMRMGRYCSVATNVRIMGIEHPTDWFTTHVGAFRWYGARFAKSEFGKTLDLPEFTPSKGDVILGHDVWIGQDVLIKPGIKIGNGAIVAAGAVVTKDVQPYAIVGGVPAKTIRMRFTPEIIDRLQRLEWWNYNYADFGGLTFDDIERFIDGLEQRIANDGIARFADQPVHLAREIELSIGDKI